MDAIIQELAQFQIALIEQLAYSTFSGGWAKTPKLAVTVTFFLTAIFCTSVMFPAINGNPVTLTLGLILAGFFMGMPMAISLTFIANSYPEHITGRVGGITMGLRILGGTIAVAAGSYALHATGLYTVPILIVRSRSSVLI